MKIEEIKLFPVKIPVKLIENGGIAPYRGSKDSDGTSFVTSAIYKVTTNDGVVGWGEANMILSKSFTNAILNNLLIPAVIGQSPFEINAMKQKIKSKYNPDINLLHFFSGIEMALWDIMGKYSRQPLVNLLGGRIRQKAEIAAAFGYMDAVDTKKMIAQLKGEGFQTFKTKGGLNCCDDIKRAMLIREEAGEYIKFRVDMNGAYSLVDAINYTEGIKECMPEYIEQPIRVNCLDEYRILRERSRVPIAINEDSYVPGAFLDAIKKNAIDAAVIDMECVGGISEIVKIAYIAENAGLPLAHHCAWDLGIKTAAIVQCVCALEAFSLAMDSTYFAHDGGVLHTKLPINDGCYEIPEGYGLGVEVDEEKIKYYLDDETTRYVF